MIRNHMLFRYFHDIGLEYALQEEPRDRTAEKGVSPMVVPGAFNAFKETPHANYNPQITVPALPSSAATATVTAASPPPSMAAQLGAAATPRRIPTTEHPAYACKSLTELRKALESFDGCALKKTATNTVFCDGNPDADVMLVGEAPGAEEDLQGKPFVGLSGQLLDKMMGAIGLDRTSVYIANIVPWRPPANRTPSTEEVALCQPFIEQHIFLKRPKFLVLLGGVATKAILNNHAGIMRLRGQWQSYTPPVPGVNVIESAGESFPPIRTLPMFHPAFLLRSPNQKVYAWEDLKTLKAALGEQ